MSISRADAAAAQFAETILSPEYLDARNRAFEENPDGYQEQEALTQSLVLDSLHARIKNGAKDWELRRQFALKTAEGQHTGAFNEFIQGRGGHDTAADLTSEDLPSGEKGPVTTNYLITSASNFESEPIDFLGEAKDIIDEQAKKGRGAIGPENYATALKCFADKYMEFPSKNLNHEIIRADVNALIGGFLEVSRRDQPNFVEMTNIYFALRSLPVGILSAEHTPGLIKESLRELPQYNEGTIKLLLAAMSKVDMSQTEGDTAAVLVDLALRKTKDFETTRDFRFALRAVANLPKGKTSERAFMTFMEKRNNLEEPLTIEESFDVVRHLKILADGTLEDPTVRQQAKQLAFNCSLRAKNLFDTAKKDFDLLPEREKQLTELLRVMYRDYQGI